MPCLTSKGDYYDFNSYINLYGRKGTRKKMNLVLDLEDLILVGKATNWDMNAVNIFLFLLCIF